MQNEHHITLIKDRLEYADRVINYYLKKGEDENGQTASAAETEIALPMWWAYMKLNPKERQKEYGTKVPISDLLGYKTLQDVVNSDS